MKSIFSPATRTELITRISTLDENSQAQWGKMNVYQMLQHCTLWDEWIQSGKKNKVAFIGRLFGSMALKKVLKGDKPLGKNTPTNPELRINRLKEKVDIEAVKAKWITLINQYEHFSNPVFIHNFFGKMTKEQVGQLTYKHTDHHLRQFNS